jgi:hypothetical protein
VDRRIRDWSMKAARQITKGTESSVKNVHGTQGERGDAGDSDSLLFTSTTKPRALDFSCMITSASNRQGLRAMEAMDETTLVAGDAAYDFRAHVGHRYWGEQIGHMRGQ